MSKTNIEYFNSYLKLFVNNIIEVPTTGMIVSRFGKFFGVSININDIRIKIIPTLLK